MKKLLLFLPILLYSIAAQAQPVITHPFGYLIGDTAMLFVCNANSVNVGQTPTGPNKTWDYSALSIIDSNTLRVIPPSSGTHSSQVPNASFVEHYSNSSNNVYEYYPSISTGSYKLLGESESSGGFFKYTTPKVVLTKPITFGSNPSMDTFRVSYTGSGYNVTGVGVTAIMAEGYGKLVLPDSTHENVLMVTHQSSQLDTIHGYPSPDSIISYYRILHYWFDTLHNTPLLRVDSVLSFYAGITTPVKTVEYLKVGKAPVSVNELTAPVISEDISAYIGDGTLTIKGDFIQSRNYDVKLYSMSGQLVEHTAFVGNSSSRILRLPLSSVISSGVYILSVTSEGYEPSIMQLIKEE